MLVRRESRTRRRRGERFDKTDDVFAARRAVEVTEVDSQRSLQNEQTPLRRDRLRGLYA